jgi:hypothetical protein
MLVVLTAIGQTKQPEITAKFSADSIMIGDQFYLDIKIDKDQTQITSFPIVGDTLIPGIEILKEYPIDTVESNGRQITLSKRYLLTSFDQGYYTVQYPILYTDKNITDTIFSSSNRLFVNTFEIDTTKQQIYDIKPQQKMSLKFGEFTGYLLITLVAVAILLWLTMRIIRYYRQRGANKITVEKPTEAPEVIAIRALEELQNEKLWQNNRHKLYYTRLTDIIRTYIDQRWDINSMEMTSSETLRAVDKLISKDIKAQLGRILTTADYVKFAKYKPETEDNEMSWNDAYDFVEQTKAIPEQETIINNNENR